MALNSMQEIFEKAASRSIPFWRVVLETDMEERQVTEEQSMEKMRAAWYAMLESTNLSQMTIFPAERAGLMTCATC